MSIKYSAVIYNNSANSTKEKREGEPSTKNLLSVFSNGKCVISGHFKLEGFGA
jgi:hypothetical protein